MSEVGAAFDQLEEKCNNYVHQLVTIRQRHDAMLELKRMHESQLDQLTKDYQSELKEQSDVYKNILVKKEEDLQLAKRKL